MDYETVDAFFGTNSPLVKALQACSNIQTSKTEHANVVELSNANSKGELHVTVKGRSDGSLDELVKEVVKQFKEAKS